MTPFAELPGHWTPILPAAEVRDRPVRVTVAGEPVVLFRGAAGIGALLDRCPHRGVALSLGEVVAGCLECPFHGWRFGTDGACTHVPFNPDVPRRPLGATALPAREAVGMVWVYTGAEATEEPTIPTLAASPTVAWGHVYEDWACHWTRVMENMLDTPHLPFVHRSTIGRGIRREMRPDSRMVQELDDLPTGYSIRYRLDDRPGGRLDWVRPNGMVLYLSDAPGRTVRMHVWCVPLEADRTRLLVAAGYDFGVLSPLAALTSFTNRRIIFEDRAVVESSSPSRVPPPSQEANVPTDKATLRFRTWYHRTLLSGA